MELRQIGIIADKEFRDRMRNRWVLAVAVVFTAFALVIAYFGGAQQGAVGLRGIDVTIASLVSLVIYLMPLIALLLGFDAIVGERERGSLDLLLALPITRCELLLGKYLGLAAALRLSTLAGFGLAGVLLSPRSAWRRCTLRRLHVQLGAARTGVPQPGRDAVGAGAATACAPAAWRSRCGSSSCWCSTCCCWACWWWPKASTTWLLSGSAAAQPRGRLPHPQRLLARRRAHALRPGNGLSAALANLWLMAAGDARLDRRRRSHSRSGDSDDTPSPAAGCCAPPARSRRAARGLPRAVEPAQPQEITQPPPARSTACCSPTTPAPRRRSTTTRARRTSSATRWRCSPCSCGPSSASASPRCSCRTWARPTGTSRGATGSTPRPRSTCRQQRMARWARPSPVFAREADAQQFAGTVWRQGAALSGNHARYGFAGRRRGAGPACEGDR